MFLKSLHHWSLEQIFAFLRIQIDLEWNHLGYLGSSQTDLRRFLEIISYRYVEFVYKYPIHEYNGTTSSWHILLLLFTIFVLYLVRYMCNFNFLQNTNLLSHSSLWLLGNWSLRMLGIYSQMYFPFPKKRIVFQAILLLLWS